MKPKNLDWVHELLPSELEELIFAVIEHRDFWGIVEAQDWCSAADDALKTIIAKKRAMAQKKWRDSIYQRGNATVAAKNVRRI